MDDKHHPSPTSPLLKPQPHINQGGCSNMESSCRGDEGTGFATNHVNDSINYGSLNDREVTDNEGCHHSNSLASDVEESRLRIIFRKVKKRRGLPLTINAVFFYSFHTLCVDFMTTELNPFQLTFMIFLLPLIGSFTLILCLRISPTRKFSVLLFYLSGGVSLFSSLCCMTFSLQYLPLGDTVAITYLSLILVGIFSWIFLGEALRILDLFLAIIALAGVVFISRPSFIFGSDDGKPFNSNVLLGTAFGLGAAFTASTLLVIARKLSLLGEHPILISFVNAFSVELLNGAVCLALGQWHRTSPTIWYWCLGAGAAFFTAQISLYIALKDESATLVNIICTLQIVLSFLCEFLFFHVVPCWTSAVGGALIMLASVGAAVTKKPVENDQQTST